MGRVLTNVLQKSGSSNGSALGESDSSGTGKSNAGNGGSNTETEKSGHYKLSSCKDSEKQDVVMEKGEERKKKEKKKKRRKKVKKLAVKEKQTK